MLRYAAPALLLIVTLCLTGLAILSVGALAGPGPVLSVQQLLHGSLVAPFGKPVAVGTLLFAGMWPTLLLFRSARTSTNSDEDLETEVEVPAKQNDSDEPEMDSPSVVERLAPRRRGILSGEADSASTDESAFGEPFDGAEETFGAPDDGDSLEGGFDPDGETDAFSDAHSDAQIDDFAEPAYPVDDVSLPEALNENRDEEPDGDDAEEFPEEDSSDPEESDSFGLTSMRVTSRQLQVEEADQMALLGLTEEQQTDLPPLPKLPNAADLDPDMGLDREPAPASSLASILGPAPFSGDSFEDEDEEHDDDRPRPDWLCDAELQAIVFRRLVPPPAEVGLSFYGGKPIVPSGFEWPRKKVEGQVRPLHFLLQVELAKIPEESRLGMLPDNGVLYVFLDLEFGSEKGFRVIHHQGPVDGWCEAEVPEDLSPVYGEEARYSWPWLDSENADETGMPRLLPLWFFDPVVARLPAVSPLERDGPNGVRWWPTDDDDIAEEMAEVQGEEVTPDTSKPVGPDGRLLRPYANYPHDWRAMAVTAVQILEELCKPSFTDACLQRQLTEEETRRMRDEWAAQARELLAWANSFDPFARVPQEQSDLFWDWFCKLDAVNHLVIARSARHAIEATLSASPIADDMFGEDALQLIRARHSLAVLTDNGLIVPTPHRMLAPASYVLGQLEEVAKDEVLLLEIAADDGLGLLLGDLVYQFTISPEDMRERRFENTRLTVSSC